MNESMLRALSEIILPAGSTSAELQTAVDGAASGDAIIISGDMPFTDTVTIPAAKEITIQSDDGNNWVMSVTIQNLRHFNNMGSLILQNITLEGGSIGGGIEGDQNVSLILKDGSIIRNCANTGDGGGINVKSGILTIDGGEVVNNKAGGAGGGIYAVGIGTLAQLLKGSISNNNSKGIGGGINVSNMQMYGGSVNYNTTDGGSGGGIYTLESLEMTDGEISYNEIRPAPAQSTASGGGLYCGGVLSAPATISGGKIHHNKIGDTPGGSRGGGICVFRGVKFYMSDAEVYENESTWGAGIFFDAYMQYGIPKENTVITGNTLIHDNKGVRGGGICFYNNVPGVPDIGILGMAPQINGNVKITGNTAAFGGGILFYPYLGGNTRVHIMMDAAIGGNAEISGNKASVRGAGIDIQDDNRGQGVIAALTVSDNVIIQKNEITEETGMGGGIFGYNANIAIQSKVSLTENAGGGFGGGIHLISSELKMSDSSVSGNSANIGGGIYIDAGSSAEISGSLIARNDAQNGDGGGIFTEDTASYGNLITGANTTFKCNSAKNAYNPPENAGALYPNIHFADITITDHPLNNFDINYSDGVPIEVMFNVVYNSNGGEGSYVGPNVEAGGTDIVLSQSETQISHDGYNFVSWNTERDGSGTQYAAGEHIIVECGITLYAQWIEIESYNIIYDCNGGNGGYIDPSREFAVQYKILSTIQTGISRDGYTFINWNTERDGSGIIRLPGEIIMIDRNLNLYAQWRRFPEQRRVCRAPGVKSRRVIEGQVLWEDNDNAGNTRPPVVEILLIRDGEVYKRISVDSDGDGYFGFCCQPAGKNPEQKYNYRIDEITPAGYAKMIEGFIVVNTLNP